MVTDDSLGVLEALADDESKGVRQVPTSSGVNDMVGL